MRERSFGSPIFDRLAQGSTDRQKLFEFAKKAVRPNIPHTSRSDLDVREGEDRNFAPWQWIPRRLRWPLISGTLTVAALMVMAADCEEEEEKTDGSTSPGPSKEEQLNFQLPVFSEDISEPWYLTGGPHSDGLSSGVRYAVDFAAQKVRKCPGSEPDPEHFAAAAEDGEVIVAGDEDDSEDENHSVVEVRHADGTITGYMHLAGIEVQVGEQVKQGDILGKISCEFPPDGSTSGQHEHFYLKDKDGKPIPIEEMALSGWKVVAADTNYNGMMEKPGEEVRTADKRRCGPDQASIDKCDGIRNDLVVGKVLGITVGEPTPTTSPLVETMEDCSRDTAKVGCPAPDLMLKTSDGQMVHLSDYKGKPTVLFLHDHCGPCVFEFDRLLDFKAQYPELQILTILNGNIVEVQKLAEKTAPVFYWDYTSGPDSLDGKYSPLGVPSAYYIDQDWIIQGIYAGIRIGKARDRDINDLVAGRPLFQRPQFESREPFSFPRPSEGIYDTNQLALFGALAFYDDKDKAAQILELVDPQIPGSEEDNITEIVDKLTQAGRIVAGYYCTNGNQVVYEFMRQLANYTSSKAADYAYEGLLDPSYYINLADAFNPACPITHFPTD